MLGILNSAERAGNFTDINSYVLNRHVFAYETAKQYMGKTVLEAGCGNGYGMRMLSQYADLYIGLDKFVTEGMEIPKNAAVFKAMFPSLQNIGDNLFDTVICFQVIEHIEEDAKLLAEIKRVLKPGGKLLMTTPNIKTSLTRNPYHIREYTCAGMQQLISAQFSNFTIEGVYGNELVMRYYTANKKSVEAITKWDVLNLQHRLPAALLKLPYNLLNNLNRKSLLKNNTQDTSNIRFTDFYLDKLSEDCLDYFVVATK